jgi:hypothetical protein
MKPTQQQLERATQTLVAIARIESLQGGVVHFGAEGLVGGQWYEPDDDLPSPHAHVWAPVPADDGDLEATARRYINQGIEYRETCLK